MSAKHLGIDLSKIEGAFIEEKHFPRPQWNVIRAWIKQNIAPEDFDAAWNEVAAGWLAALRGKSWRHLRRPPVQKLFPAHQQERRGGHVHSGHLRNGGEASCPLAGDDRREARSRAACGSRFRGPWKLLRLCFLLLPGGSGVAASGGIFIRGRGTNTLPCLRTGACRTPSSMSSSTTDSPICGCPPGSMKESPSRRNGGLSSSRRDMLDRELLRKHRDYWSATTIATFWEGASFHNDDGEVIHLSYSLAEVLVDLLVQEFPNFMLFVAKAGDEDAGESAAKETLQVSLGDVVAAFSWPRGNGRHVLQAKMHNHPPF